MYLCDFDKDNEQAFMWIIPISFGCWRKNDLHNEKQKCTLYMYKSGSVSPLFFLEKVPDIGLFCYII